MPSLGPTELVVILVLAIVLFGAGKIGDIGGALGKSIREFRHAANEDEPRVETTQQPTTPGPQKFCPSCGAAVRETDRFCSACGAKLEPNQAA